jgi:hypothetical protein
MVLNLWLCVWKSQYTTTSHDFVCIFPSQFFNRQLVLFFNMPCSFKDHLWLPMWNINKLASYFSMLYPLKIMLGFLSNTKKNIIFFINVYCLPFDSFLSLSIARMHVCAYFFVRCLLCAISASFCSVSNRMKWIVL